MPRKLFSTLTRAAAAASLIFGTAFAAPSPVESAARPPAAPQCKRQDTVVVKPLRFQRGRTTAVLKDAVRLCTSHEYRLRASAGQTMSVNLAAGRRTSLTVYAPASGIIEGADGVKSWSGELPETGEYVINVGTDATAAYTLEVTIR
ncbi:MAG TPA: hypothetical protein VF611_04950 [Pyrinomonadaceae bacterium]|jgi:hypothetical protein